MKQITIFLIAVLLVSTSFAQLSKIVDNGPTVLSSVQSKSLPMPISGSKAVVDTLNYAGANASSVGTGAASTFGVYALHPVAVMTPLVGNFITEVRFYINGASNVASAEIQLYNDTTTAVFTQVVAGVVEGWNTVLLNPSYPITADQLYVGYEVVATGGYPAGTDAGPRESNGYGDVMNFGKWTTANALSSTLDANWNIKAVVADVAVTCFPPTAVTYSNTTFNSTDIAWTSTSTAWNLKISSTMIDPTTGTGNIFDGAATTASYSATGLTELTDYYVYVQSDCGSGTTSSWLTSTFSTPKDCSAGITAPWMDDMSAGIDCWALYDVDGDGYNWENTEVVVGNLSLNSFSYDNDASTALNPDNWAVSNKINIDALTTPFLSWTAHSFDANYPSEQYSVYISTTGNTPADFGTAAFNETLNSDSDVLRNISLASYSGDIWVAFRHHDTYDMFGFSIDNVKVDNTVSINSNTATTVDFTIYPNPANEKVTIANAEGQNIIILDITGKVVLTIEAATKLQEVNISDFAAGTYIVRVNASVSKFNVIK